MDKKAFEDVLHQMVMDVSSAAHAPKKSKKEEPSQEPSQMYSKKAPAPSTTEASKKQPAPSTDICSKKGLTLPTTEIPKKQPVHSSGTTTTYTYLNPSGEHILTSAPCRIEELFHGNPLSTGGQGSLSLVFSQYQPKDLPGDWSRQKRVLKTMGAHPRTAQHIQEYLQGETHFLHNLSGKGLAITDPLKDVVIGEYDRAGKLIRVGYTMPFIDGTILRSLPREKICPFLRDIYQQLMYLHTAPNTASGGRGKAHCDAHSKNVMVQKTPGEIPFEYVLVDYDLSLSSPLTLPRGVYFGTLPYLPPEFTPTHELSRVIDLQAVDVYNAMHAAVDAVTSGQIVQKWYDPREPDSPQNKTDVSPVIDWIKSSSLEKPIKELGLAALEYKPENRPSAKTIFEGASRYC